jgi:LmbE family N-acetylglucosaminyl deacetylase
MSDFKERSKSLLQSFFLTYARDLDIPADAGSSLVIAPHPDDESLGCGATIARLRARGQRVQIVIVTDGSASGRSAVIGPKKLAAVRRLETGNATAALGVPSEDVIFLDFQDSHTQEQASAIETALCNQIRLLSPRRIFSPYGVDCHSDHRVIAAVIDRLCRRRIVSCHVFEYPIWFWPYGALGHMMQPNKLRRLRRVPTREFLAPKMVAIAAHVSQNVALTDEAGWFTFPDGFLPRFLTPFELFFEKVVHKERPSKS